MFLKRLELQGFKSFPNRTKVEFNKGVTAIVGPNGSGKSNILDAILWVLGEQSAKTLRGVKMEDIIFGGTENRKPMSFAEVSIIIDNSKKYFNVEYDEVVVTRKVFRSGESEYYINNKTCRLKDITELFMDTGVGKDGYSIISQGKVEEIVSNKGNDRKQFFDEAVGIVKYRSKKIEALNNLKKERENLERVELIINELAMQLEPLKLESEKAKEFLEYRDELREIEITRFVRDVLSIEEEIKIIEKDIAVSELELKRLEVQQNKEKQNKKDIEENIQNAENEKEKLTKHINDATIEINNCDNAVSSTKSSIIYLQKEENRLKEELKETQNSIKNNETKIQNILTDIDSKQLEKRIIELELNEFEKTHKDILEAIEKNDEDKEKYTKEYLSLSDEQNNLTLKHDSFNQTLQFKNNVISEKENEVFMIGNKIKEKKLKIEVNQKRKSMLEADIQELTSNAQKETKNLKDIKEMLVHKNNELKNLTKEYDTNKNKISFLENLTKENEGLNYSVKYILNKNINGVVDVVGNLLQVSEKYLLAVDTALGGAMQNIVVEDENVAKECINDLKNNKKGRATFLPISAMKSRKLNTDLKECKGFLGLALNLVSFDKKFKPIFENLLGNVVVVENIDDGIKISKKFNATFRIVTLDGQVLNIGGSMVGGSKNNKNTSILTRKQELQYCLKKLEILEKDKQSLEEEENLLYNKVSHIEDIRDKYASQYNDLTFLLKEIDIKNSSIDEEIKKDINNKEYSEKSIMSLQEEKSKLEVNMKTVKEELDKLLLKQEEISQKLTNVTENYEKGESLKNNYFKTLSDFKININNIDTYLNNSQNKIVDIKDEVIHLNKNIMKTEDLIAKCQSDVLEKDKSISKLLLEKDNKVIYRENCNSLLEETSKNLVDLKNLVKNIYTNIEEIGNERHNVETTKVTLDNKKNALEEKNDAFHEYIWNKYDITYIDAKEEDFIDELLQDKEIDRKERVLKSKIKSLGDVNVSSIDRYVSDKERFDFLNTQRDDIIKSEKDILKLVDNLTVEMEEKFKTQLEVIRKNFNNVFKELFGGGEAKLVLTDEENILESNIEIKAQPPGKKLNHMTLLSGGEKALTAISLLFAILLMKPSPFCILDEVESALDDANVTKYGEYLQQLTKYTQFIAITHRNGTMESADTLYGVTMQEKGISTLVSVEFN